MSEMSHRSDEAVPIVYDELRRLAADHLAHEPAGQTLSPTSLVHEAYLRLAAADHWESPRHFYHAAALAMRRILIDRVRARRADKRGGGRTRVALDVADPATEPVVDYLDLDAALNGLAAEDELAAELIHLRFFAGLTRDAAAELLEISPRQADRIWAFGKAWLYQRLRV